MKGTLKQILLITDGYSNDGEDPIAIARLAQEFGIAVNVIGIMGDQKENAHGLNEVEAIADAGGGVSEIVYARQLSQTVQVVTQKAMTQTLHGVINQELKQILGKGEEMDSLPPEKRGEVMEVVDEISETAHLEVCILIDTSASMANKLTKVQEALEDLSIGLHSRTGDTSFAVYTFPGRKYPIEKVMDFSPTLNRLTKLLSKLSSGGMTPTGPALKAALSVMKESGSRRRVIGHEDDQLFG
ncbi:vWA domain-containing protein [Shouchella hunanensis]|uniref:VWA domain-containing protein n=1 Tax=Shouchella hunanensis TaxID=766894 RepID=A0ABY7WAD2_9BACI|nr:VWA domain-containing protein [Shouchella hunanensis]WDF05409.1 VWA domain-containing protein [Shouchella hunanensis]